MAAAFRRYAEAAGVTRRKRVTPDSLRHVFATELLGAGANLPQIQDAHERRSADRSGLPQYARRH